MAFGSLTQWWRSFSSEDLTFEKHKSSSEHSEDWSLWRGENYALRKRLLRGEHRTAMEIFLTNAGWQRSATNLALETAATQNESYIVDGNWTFLITERVNSLGQKFSRFIGELQRHSLDIHVCFLFQCVSEMISVVLVQCRHYDGCMINFLIKLMLFLAYPVSPLRQNWKKIFCQARATWTM